MISAILFAFLLSILAVIISGLIIGMFVFYKKVTNSVECNRIMENILIKMYENKNKI